MFGKLKVKLFESKLNKCKDRANNLYIQNGDVVVCEYCGQLLPKKEAGIIYDIEKNKIKFHHEDCFQKYENHPTEIKPKEE